MARKLKAYPTVSVCLEDFDGKIDFARIFGRSGSVHIDIGSGKGTFLVNEAKALPETNFLGIERASRYYRYCVDRVGRWALRNVRVIRTDAVELITNYLPDESVDCFHVYFPDPWPKRKHHKRRFFKYENLQQLLRTRKTKGEIKIATDHPDYFELITKLMESYWNRIEKTGFFPASGAEAGEGVGTNFERKYLKESRTIHLLAVRKI